MKKFFFILFFLFLFETKSWSINKFKYSKEPITGEFCQKLLSELNFPGFPAKDLPVKINTELLVEEINNVDGKSLSYDALYTLWMYWIDHRVAGVLKKLGKYENTDEPTYLCDYEVASVWGEKRKLFDPVIEVYNQKKTPKYSDRFNWIEIFSNGTVQARLRDTNEFKSKNIDFSKFPFDKHSFIFEVYSEFPKDIVEFVPNEKMALYEKNLYKFDSEDGLTTPDWKVTKVKTSAITFKKDKYDYSGFVVEIEAKRQVIYYIFKIMMPVVFLIIITWSVFWIKVTELQSKVNVSVVTLLALIAYNFVFEKDIPKLSYLTYLDIFILISYFFAGMATILAVYSHWRFVVYEDTANSVSVTMRKYGPLLYIITNLLLIFIFIYI